MSTLVPSFMHWFAEAHALLRAAALALAAVVTLGSIAALARLADREYFDALVVQAQQDLEAAHKYVTGPRLP